MTATNLDLAAFAHHFESNGQWTLAAACWAELQDPMNTAACRMLAMEMPTQVAEAN